MDDISQADSLSAREREVLTAFGEGLTVTSAAARFGLSVKTVSTYRARILEKLALAGAIDSRSTAALIRYAIKSGLVQ